MTTRRWIMHLVHVPTNGDTPYRGICGFPRYSKKKNNLTSVVEDVTCKGCLEIRRKRR